jgi:DNA-directed RNA polymerase subunit RPC12/RpoP
MAKKSIPNPLIRTYVCVQCGNKFSKDQWQGTGGLCKKCSENTVIISTGEDIHGNLGFKRVKKE